MGVRRTGSLAVGALHGADRRPNSAQLLFRPIALALGWALDSDAPGQVKGLDRFRRPGEDAVVCEEP
jgi:hypothetical protein